MPVRSLTQSVLRWPEPELVLRQVTDWAVRMAADHQGLERVGVFDSQAAGPQHQRLLVWPLAELPLSCDALVLTPAEHADLLANGSAMAAALARDNRWLWPPTSA